jgi:hypothetical protein
MQPTTFGAVNGFTFGASENNQSFPTGINPPGNAGFTFNVPPTTSNPFANINYNNSANTNPNANANSNSFPNGVFGGQDVNSGKRGSDDMMMESPEKKPPLFSGFQPSQSQQQQQPSVFSGFSNIQSNGLNSGNSQSHGLFGAVSQPSQPQNNLFGQTQPSQPAFGGFNQTSQNDAQPNTFDHAQQKEQTPTPPPSFSFGQSAEPLKPLFDQSSQATPFPSFGQTATTSQQQAPLFGSAAASQPAPMFNSGVSSSAPSTSGNPFGGFQAPASSIVGLFGQKPETSTSVSAEMQSSSSQPSTGLFGQPASTAPTSTLFGQTASPTKEPTKFTFGSTSQFTSSTNSEDKAAEANPKPFGNLFPSTPSSAPASVPTAASAAPQFSFSQSSAAPAATSTSSLFGVPAPAQSSNSGLFGQVSDNKTPPPASVGASTSESEPPQVAAAHPKPTTAFSGFGNAPSTSSGLFFTPAKTMESSKPPATETVKSSLFGDTATPLFQKTSAQVPEPATEKVKKPLFGRTLDSSSTLAQPSDPEPDTKAPSFQPSSLEQRTASTKSATPPSTFAPASNPMAKETSSIAVSSQPAGPPPKRPVYTKSPARIPNYLNGEGYKEYDGNYRLRALNREFQRRIARLDPARQDFENVIRHYVSARASIGADLGLYQRIVAGTKRKNDTIEEELEVPQQYKKPRNGATQSTEAPSSSARANVISAPAPQGGQQNMFAGNKPVSNAPTNASSPSKATSLLNNMIPGSLANNADSDKLLSAPATGSSFVRGVVTSIEESGGPADQSKPRTTSTTPKKSPLKPPFTAPPSVFSGNAFAAFGQAAASGEKKRKAARLEEDYDSDEDSQAEGKKQLEEEERAKRARYDAIPKTGFMPTFGVKYTSPKSSPSKAKRSGPFEEEDSDDDAEAEADDEETAEERDGSFAPDEEETTESEEEGEEEEEEEGAASTS